MKKKRGKKHIYNWIRIHSFEKKKCRELIKEKTYIFILNTEKVPSKPQRINHPTILNRSHRYLPILSFLLLKTTTRMDQRRETTMWDEWRTKNWKSSSKRWSSTRTNRSPIISVCFRPLYSYSTRNRLRLNRLETEKLAKRPTSCDICSSWRKTDFLPSFFTMISWSKKTTLNLKSRI